MNMLTNLLDDYTGHLRALRMSPRTIRTTTYNNLAFLRWLSARRQIHTAANLDQTATEHWFRHISAWRTTKGRPLKPASINKSIACVRGFLKHLARRGLVMPSLPDSLSPVKEPYLLPGSVLDHDQVRKLLAAIPAGTPCSCRDRALLELLYSTGIRVGELISLNVHDLDLRNATMLVNGKGDKQRVVPVGRTALRHMESYIKAIRPFLQRDGAEPAMFLDQSGNRIQRHTIARRLTLYAARARLDIRVTPHTFRRSCTTELIRAGANLYHVKDLLGHETLDTLKHYTRLTINDLRDTHRKCHPREREYK